MWDNIPTELIREIFSRLPAPTLFRFRRVCMAWRDMIDDPCFIASHLDRQLLNSSDGRGHLVFRSNKGHGYPCFVPVRSLVTNSSSGKTIEVLPFLRRVKPSLNRFGFEKAYRMSSCNGVMFVCRRIDLHSILWNPSTGESHHLPVHTRPVLNRSVVVGFRYDYVNNDYKVVNLITTVHLRRRHFETETMVYSLKSDSWKRIKEFSYFIESTDGDGVYLNGALHWLADDLIAGIDLGTENHFEMQIPITKHFGFYEKQINVLGGCISLNCLSCDPGMTIMELWLMNDYKVESSWSKLFSIVKQENNLYFPIIYSKSRGILQLDNQTGSRMRSPEYVCLDLDDNMSARKVTVDDDATAINACSTFHLETLVRLNIREGGCKRKREC